MDVTKQPTLVRPLTATHLAQYYHYNCDRFLHNIYHKRQPSKPLSDSNGNELSAAQYRRGNSWEDTLYTWLRENDLLLTIPSRPIDGDSLAANIEFDDRPRFFITGLNLDPQVLLDARFRGLGTTPVVFGLAKPDLIEIVRDGHSICWRVIDAKASAGLKPSHQIQTYFYTLCLEHILHSFPLFRKQGSVGIWLPPSEGSPPSTKNVKNIKLSLLSPLLDSFLFSDLPKLLSYKREEVKWHYNPLCQSCPFQPGCKTQTIEQKELGSIPNIGLEEVGLLRTLLHRYRSLSSNPGHSTDIEDLHNLFNKPSALNVIERSFPRTVKESRLLLCNRDTSVSPVVEAALTGTPQIKVRRTLSCPAHEDIAIFLSLACDHASSTEKIERYAINVFAPKDLLISSRAHGGERDNLIPTLASLIREILGLQQRPLTQFYVWSTSEFLVLERHLIDSTLTACSPTTQQDIKLCIGALAEGASLLRTKIQPTILKSGPLLGLLTEYRTKTEFIKCAERLGLPIHGSVIELRDRISRYIQQGSDGHATRSGNAEVGDVPRVVVLKKEIERLIALPVPGFWDLPQAASTLLSDCLLTCSLSDEYVQKLLDAAAEEQLEQVLNERNNIAFRLLQNVRKRILDAGYRLLVKDATVLRSSFMDLCRQEHLRKLFFMQQFEVLTKLSDFWRARVDGCPDAPVLQYAGKVAGTETAHIFDIIGAPNRVSVAGGRSMYEMILVADEADDPCGGVPVEALFDDLAVAGVTFPMAAAAAGWNEQHPTVKKKLCIAKVQDITADTTAAGEDRTRVVLDVYGRLERSFTTGARYRMSPRLVDFTTSKTLAALFEMDLRCTDSAVHDGQPLLQMILDPAGFGRVAEADEFVEMGNERQSVFRELKNLGSEAAAPLVLKASQHRAAQMILSNRLSVVWGPPGTGKTHTIALSLLRLLEMEHRHDRNSGRTIFITAVTHAAIKACRNKVDKLRECYRALGRSTDLEWLDRISIEDVKPSYQHRPPSYAVDGKVHVYAGTLYQLYNFSKKHAIEVDCVMIDEAGQLSLAAVSLVLCNLRDTGRIVVAGDSEQLAPIVSGKYPRLPGRPILGSVLECIMNDSESSWVVQLTENFRLNPDLGDFVSTIYSRAFKPQKVQDQQKLGRQLGTVRRTDGEVDGISESVMKEVKTFLGALSDVMLGKKQKVLRRSGAVEEGSFGAQEVSLALMKLKEGREVGQESWVRGEAGVAAGLVWYLQQCCGEDDVFVATPQKVQRAAVKAALTRAGVGLENGRVRVDTVERLQGSEAAFVICLFSVCSSGRSGRDVEFVLNRRRLNVGISRAKTLCVVLTSGAVFEPKVGSVLGNEETAKGYAFLRDYGERAWGGEIRIE